jgi:dihydropteroate synthase
MGIVNVTPDSFSDGGLYLSADRAIAHGFRLIEEGADILDIGGESTRPGAQPVGVQEELDRVLPVIEGLQGCGAQISVDTRHAEVMRAALAAGADMVNDISALRGEGSLEVVAASGARICLMHMQGEPATMQDAPSYLNVVDEVLAFLRERIAICETAGIGRERLVADPGIGFGKTAVHNWQLLNALDRFAELGMPLLVGVSRKRFLDEQAPPEGRLAGAVAASLWALGKGASIFRVHDVAAMRQAFKVQKSLEEA